MHLGGYLNYLLCIYSSLQDAIHCSLYIRIQPFAKPAVDAMLMRTPPFPFLSVLIYSWAKILPLTTAVCRIYLKSYLYSLKVFRKHDSIKANKVL